MDKNQYEIELKARISEQLEGLAQAKAKLRKEKFEVELKFAFEKGGGKNGVPDSIAKRFEEIKKSAETISRMKATKKDGDLITQYEVQWIDKAGNEYKELYNWVKKTNQETKEDESYWSTTTTSIDNINKRVKERISLEEKVVRETEKQLSAMERQKLYADKFLERSKTLEKTPEVRKGVDIAQKIKLETDPKVIANLTKDLQVLDAGIRQSGHSAWSWGEQMKVAMQRAMEWASVTTLIYQSLQMLGDGINYIKELDKEMTNIQIATGRTDEEISKLAMDYNVLAKELKISTLEVARGATTWLKQGKSVEETGILIRDTAILAKLGLVDTADASEYLTSTLNGFQLTADDAIGVIDKLIAVDNAAATSTSELSLALSRSANMARISGVDFEHLVSYIGTVSSVTRRSAKSKLAHYGIINNP
jgi:hypothetical protein